MAALCPHLAWVEGDEPAVGPAERVLWRGAALVRVHGSFGADDGRPLRHSDDVEARLVALAAGTGPVVVTDRRVTGVLRATTSRPALGYALAWDEVDDVSAATSGGVLFLSTRLLGGLTVDPVGS